jgi:hypothetical protein
MDASDRRAAAKGSVPSGLSRRDLLRRGGAAGGALLWAVPAIQVIDLTAAHAGYRSGYDHDGLPSHCEVIVRCKTSRTFSSNGKSYTTRVGDVCGLKYDASQGGWVHAKANPASCIPAGTGYTTSDAVLADFRQSVAVGTTVWGSAPAYVLQLPDRYELQQGWRKKGSARSYGGGSQYGSCQPMVTVGRVCYFQGW